MNHRGKVSKDFNGLWSGVCDCSETWASTRWRDVFDATHDHVRARRRGQALGFGFRSQGQFFVKLGTGGSFFAPGVDNG